LFKFLKFQIGSFQTPDTLLPNCTADFSGYAFQFTNEKQFIGGTILILERKIEIEASTILIDCILREIAVLPVATGSIPGKFMEPRENYLDSTDFQHSIQNTTFISCLPQCY
jgi:hypothetical protein